MIEAIGKDRMEGRRFGKRKRVLFFVYLQGDWLSRMKRKVIGAPLSIYQFGFFYDSLRTCCEVDTMTSVADFQAAVRGAYDWLVLDYRVVEFFPDLAPEEAIRRMLRGWESTPKALLVRNPNASVIPGNEILNQFDVIFKREALIDRDRYGHLSTDNRRKIRTTMLPCPVLLGSPRKQRRAFRRLERQFPDRSHWQHDVYFRGAPTTPSRAAFVKALRESELDFVGDVAELRSTLSRLTMGQYLSRRQHIAAISRSAISLALEGYGEFTFRHLEIWALGGFCLSAPSIRMLDLPLPVREGVHYHCFDGPGSIVSVCRELLNEPGYLRQVRVNGRDLMRRYYSPKAHGGAILASLEEVSG